MNSEAEQLVALRPLAWVETWARRIEALGLSSMVLPLIEIAHAFGFLGSHVLLMAQPLMSGIVNDTTLEQISALLDSPELLEHLEMCLEGKED